jgi:hypothetical protein
MLKMFAKFFCLKIVAQSPIVVSQSEIIENNTFTRLKRIYEYFLYYKNKQPKRTVKNMDYRWMRQSANERRGLSGLNESGSQWEIRITQPMRDEAYLSRMRLAANGRQALPGLDASRSQ